MKILHISDTHGSLPEPLTSDFDVVVHSGDLLPNRSYGKSEAECLFQRTWLEEHAPRFSPHYWGRPVLFTPGNHDWIDPTPILRSLGMDARLLIGHLELDDVEFWGHPWTPRFYDWNWMCGPAEMKGHLTPAAKLMMQGRIDVLVSHGPMYGLLDRNQDGERCGCPVMRDVLQSVRFPPSWLLHGHIHEANGLQGWSRGVRVSNAARGQRVVTV